MRVYKSTQSLVTMAAFALASLMTFSMSHAQNLGANLSLTGPGAGADGSGFSDTKRVRDGSTSTYTQASGTSNQRVSVKWSSAVSFNTVVLRESGSNVANWQLVNNDTGAVLATGSGIGSARTVNVGSVSMKKLNLVVNGSSPLRMAEIEVYNANGSPSSSSVSSSASSTPASSSASSSSAPAGNLMSCQDANAVRGFASLGGGTTGGNGGTSVTVTTGAQLVTALASKKNNAAPLKIYVNGTITPSNSGVSQFDIKDMENISILGVGTNALFDGIGLNIVRANNVIVRNLTIRYNRIGQKDGISIDGTSTNVWIDHNELYNSLNVNKDYYDELVSGKGQIDNITISYNYLHDSWKTSLWGSSDSNSYERRVTFHHNRWENVNSRLPLFRFGQAHIFNNYYKNVADTGINSRMGARVRIDNNYFENVKNPIVSFYSSQIGYWHTAGNVFDNVTWVEYPSDGIIAGPNVGSTVNYTPPYSYSLMSAAAAKSHVLANAGVGKLNGCL